MTNPTCTVIDTPEGIDFVRVLSMRSALRLECGTGMKMSRGVSVMKLVNQRFGTTFRQKQKALDFLNDLLAEFDARN